MNGNSDFNDENIDSGLDSEERNNEVEAIPFEPSKIDIVALPMTLGQLLDRLENDELDLTPDFQRQANLWDAKRKSRLIESVLLKIPLPSFYFSENDKGVYSVVDGLQRLCALFHFMQPEELSRVIGLKKSLTKFSLSDLQYLKELEGKDFDSLDRLLQRRIRELVITVNVIRANTPNAVKFNVFARLNQGGLPLNAQEIRNAIYPGRWRFELDELARSSDFLRVTGRQIKTDRQEDLELVLRFVALWQLGTPFKRSENKPLLDEFLNDQIENHIQKWSAQDWMQVKNVFYKVLNAAECIFERHVFRKSFGQNSRTPINRGLFEAQLVTLSSLSDAEICILKNRRREVQDRFGSELKIGGLFSTAVLWKTASAEASNKRIDVLSRIYQGVINVE